jgi:hypothetical protein
MPLALLPLPYMLVWFTVITFWYSPLYHGFLELSLSVIAVLAAYDGNHLIAAKFGMGVIGLFPFTCHVIVGRNVALSPVTSIAISHAEATAHTYDTQNKQ